MKQNQDDKNDQNQDNRQNQDQNKDNRDNQDDKDNKDRKQPPKKDQDGQGDKPDKQDPDQGDGGENPRTRTRPGKGGAQQERWSREEAERMLDAVQGSRGQHQEESGWPQSARGGPFGQELVGAIQPRACAVNVRGTRGGA